MAKAKEADDQVITESSISSNGYHDDEMFTFELPERMPDCPPPSTTKTRRLEMPDGEHYFLVRGGGTQREGRYLTWSLDQLTKAADRHKKQQQQADLDIKAGRPASPVDDAALQRAEMLFNARFATFVADRVVDHNFYNDDGEKLPLGMALFFEFRGTDAAAIAWRIHGRESIWHDPKAEKPSTTG